MIVYAHPQTLRILSEQNRRFAGTRWSLRARLYAAWLVFTGRADALLWRDERGWPK
jgi:hypothetical protein